MEEEIISYKTADHTFDIPKSKESDFLKDNPSAIPVKSFVVGKDTLDIPYEKVSQFLAEVPQAKPLYEAKPQPSVNVPLFGNVTAEQIQSAPTPPAIKQNAVAQEMLANKNIPIVSNALQTQQTTDPNILAAQNVISVQQNNAEKESTYQKELKRQQKELQATKTLARNEFERSKAADATMLDAYKFAESKYMAGDKSPEIVNFLKQNKNAFDNTMKGVDESYKIWGLTHVADKASKEKGIDSKISTLVDEYFAKPIEGEKQRPKAVILGEIHKLNPDFVIDESQSNSEKSAQINELYKDAVIDYQLARREYDKAKAEMDKVVPLAHTTPLVSKLPTEGFFPEVKRFNEAERALGESGDRVKALYKSAVLKEDLGEEYNKYLQNRGVGMKVAENTINPAVAGFASFFNPLTPSGKGEISTTVSGQSEQQKLANVLGEIKGEQANKAEKSASPSFAQNVFKGAGELGGMIAQQAPLMPIGEAVAEPLFAKFVPEAIKGTLAGSIRAGLITAGKDAATFYAASGDPNQAVMGAEYGLATGLGSSLNVLADTNPFIVKLAEKSPFAANIAQVTGKSVVGTGITVSGAEALRLAHAGVDYMVTDDTFKDALTKAGIDPNVSSELNHRIAEMVTLGIVGAPHLFKAINKEEQARLREVAIKAGASPELADAIVANPEESKEKAAQNKDEVVEDILGGLKPNGTEVKKTVVEAQPEAQPTAEVTQEEIPKENDIVSYKLNNKTYKGVLSKNNQGYFIETKNGDIVELGNEIPIDKLQIEEPNIKFVNETDIEVGGRQYKNAESVYDDNGNLRYVKTLDENNNDKLFSGEIAKEIAYNIHLRDLEKLDDNDLNIAYEYATTKNKGTENQGTEKITEGGITKSNELSPQEEERKRLEDEFKVAEEIILDEAKNKLDKQSFVNATDRNGDIKLHEIRTINGKKRVYLNGKEIKQKAHKGRVLKSLSDNGAMNEKAVLKNALKQLEDYKKSELEKLNNQNKQTNEKQEVQIREQQERQGNEGNERREPQGGNAGQEANAETQKEVVEGEATPQQPIEETTEQELNKARLISDKNEREAAIKRILNSNKLKNNAQFILDNANYRKRNKNSFLVRLPIDFVLDNQEKDFKVQRGQNEIGNRIDKAKKHLESNPKELEPSDIYIKDSGKDRGKIGFGDGRHRLIAAKELGATHAYFELPSTKEQFDALNYLLSEFGNEKGIDHTELYSTQGDYKVIQTSDNTFILNKGNDVYTIKLNKSGGVDNAEIIKNGKIIKGEPNLLLAIQNHLTEINPESNARNINKFLGRDLNKPIPTLDKVSKKEQFKIDKLLEEETIKPNENAITKSEQQQQEINQQGGVGEHQGTEIARNEAPQSEADNSDFNIGGKETEVTPNEGSVGDVDLGGGIKNKVTGSGIHVLPIAEIDNLRSQKETDLVTGNAVSLEKDLTKNGIKEPLVITYYPNEGKAVLTDGHNRLDVAKDMGAEKLPIRIVEKYTDAPNNAKDWTPPQSEIKAEAPKEKTPLTLEERIRKIADDYENNTPEHLKTIITQGVSKDTVIKAMRLIADTIEKGGKAIEAIKAAIRKGVDYITSKHKEVDKKAVEEALTKQIEAEAKAAKQAHIETYDKLKDAFVSRIKEQVDALPTNEAKKEVIKNAVEIIKQNPKFEKTIEGAETSEQDFIDHAEKQLLKEEEPLKPEEEENPQPTEKEKAESMIDQLKNIGKNAEQVESEAVTHRGETGMQVVSEKTKMRTILPLIASDAEQALAKFNDTYKQDYLNKAIDAFLNWNALTGGETKDLTARAAFGIAIENEIRRLQDGTIENKYDLNQRDLETALRRFQPIAAEISQAVASTLNVQKNLYNIFDESEAAQEMLSPKEQTLSKDIQETLQNKDKQLDEAAEEFETQPEKPIEQPKEKPKKETKNKLDKRKPKKVSAKEGVDAKAKKKSVLEDLKKELKKLKC